MSEGPVNAKSVNKEEETSVRAVITIANDALTSHHSFASLSSASSSSPRFFSTFLGFLAPANANTVNKEEEWSVHAAVAMVKDGLTTDFQCLSPLSSTTQG